METLNILAVWRWVYYSERNAMQYYNSYAIANAIANAIQNYNGDNNGAVNSIQNTNDNAAAKLTECW